jgi:hypothetical protein
LRKLTGKERIEILIPIDRFLLGDNPFIGVNHLSQEKSRDTSLGVEAICNVITAALESGAQGLAFSVHSNMYNALKGLKEQGYYKRFGLYPVFPDAYSNVRAASEKGMVGLISDMFGKMDLGTKARSMVSGGLGALTMDPSRIMRTYLDAQLSIFMKVAPVGARLKAVFLHEIITDLIVSFNLRDIFLDFVGFVSDSLNASPGFVTRNFARFSEFVTENSKNFVVMTPFNKVGFQMNPSREACEKGLAQFPDSSVIAMSVLASGYLGLGEAAGYLKTLQKQVSCVVGVSSEVHARETFSYLKSNL